MSVSAGWLAGWDVPFPCNFFEASHWPSDHMIRFHPLIAMQIAYLIGIGASICIGQEIRCLPYAGFLVFGVANQLDTGLKGK